MIVDHGFQHIGEIMRGVLKELSRRVELRLRLEAERGQPLTDEDFLAIARKDGIPL